MSSKIVPIQSKYMSEIEYFRFKMTLTQCTMDVHRICAFVWLKHSNIASFTFSGTTIPISSILLGRDVTGTCPLLSSDDKFYKLCFLDKMISKSNNTFLWHVKFSIQIFMVDKYACDLDFKINKQLSDRNLATRKFQNGDVNKFFGLLNLMKLWFSTI